MAGVQCCVTSWGSAGQRVMSCVGCVLPGALQGRGKPIACVKVNRLQHCVMRRRGGKKGWKKQHLIIQDLQAAKSSRTASLQPGMRHSFVGSLLSPLWVSRRVGYTSMKRGKEGRKKNHCFLFAQLSFFTYSIFVCWEILIRVDQ